MDTGQRSAYEFVLTLKSLCTQTLCNPLSRLYSSTALHPPNSPAAFATSYRLRSVRHSPRCHHRRGQVGSERAHVCERALCISTYSLCNESHDTPYTVAHRHQARPLPLARFTRALPSSNRATGPQLDPCLHLRSERFGHRGVNPVAPQRDCRQVEPRARPVRRAEH